MRCWNIEHLLFCIVRDRVADFVSVVDIEVSLRSTEYSLDCAGRRLLTRHEVFLTKASVLQFQKAVYVVYSDVDDFRCRFCGSSLLLLCTKVCASQWLEKLP